MSYGVRVGTTDPQVRIANQFDGAWLDNLLWTVDDFVARHGNLWP